MPLAATRRLLATIKQPLSRLLDLLGPHYGQINAAWRAGLDRLQLSRHEVEALACLNLVELTRELRAGNVNGYQQAVEHQAHLLAERGVPEEHAIAALALFEESCLPYLNSRMADGNKLPLALSRLVSSAELFVISGYENQRAASWRTLEQRLHQAEQRLRNFSIHLINISEQDRSRLSRDLHDEVGHNLLVLKLYMEMIALDLKEGKTNQVGQKLEEAVGLVGQAIEGVRRLAFNLGPAILDEMGFVPSLKRYARQFTARTKIKVRVQTGRLPAELPSSYEVALYRVFQGALSNVAQHAHANNVKVTMGRDKASLFMTIEDDGIGFDVESKLRAPDQAFGLMAMRQRIELLGGSIRAESRPSRPRSRDTGTRIEVTLPLLETANERQGQNSDLR